MGSGFRARSSGKGEARVKSGEGLDHMRQPHRPRAGGTHTRRGLVRVRDRVRVRATVRATARVSHAARPLSDAIWSGVSPSCGLYLVRVRVRLSRRIEVQGLS